jgi:hypothetical protein
VPTPPAVDPFSPKSSRIVRALLTQPAEGWQVRQLAEHPDVRVSPGLVVKVKRALVEEGYAVERQRLLYLRDPVGLLEEWVGKYPGPAEQVPFYFRGNVEQAEHAVENWCVEHGLRHALAGLSAAWRLAPEVRYNVASVYVEDRGFDPDLLVRLTRDHGGRRVDTGATLTLWRPYDPSVFVFAPPLTTSPLQTYLDLRRTAGRGEDAAKAVYDKWLASDLKAAAERAKEWASGGR